jgi:hypothetical protein
MIMLARVCREKTVLRRNAMAIVLFICVAQTAVSQTVPTSLDASRGRRLAPDALEVIPPSAEQGETALGPVTLPLVVKHPELSWKPNYAPVSDTLVAKSTDVIFRNDVYCLEFAFKPVRMIQVNDKLVWYLLYRVRYLGGDMRPEPLKDSFGNEIFANPQAVSAEWVRFMPTFVLRSLGANQEYLDRILPAAKPLIAAKERVGKPIYDSTEIQRLKIGLSNELANNEVWGVATWVDVDSRTDFFSIRVRGLTNAQKLELQGEEINYLQKTLVLHFSRPGDTVDEIEDPIRYGVPALEDPARQKYVLDQYGLQERLDYLWIYR